MKKIATIGGLLVACGAANAQLYTPAFNFVLADNAGGTGSIAPQDIFVTGGDIGIPGETEWQGVAPAAGTLSFNWAYVSSDSGCFDTGYMDVNGGRTTLACNTSSPANGAMVVPMNAGDTIDFGVFTADGIFGPGHLEIRGFEFKVIPTPGSMALLGLGGLVAARRRR